MSRWIHELQQVTRVLARAPGFSTVSILTLALGIGATTAIFTVVNGVLLRPLPYSEPEGLVGLWHTAPGIGMPQVEQSEGTYFLYKGEGRAFEDIGAYDEDAVNLTGGDEPERVASVSVTASVLPILGIRPLRGRWIAEAEDQPGAPPVALVGESLWRRKFGADPGIVGRTIQVNGVSREIVGVMPATFGFPSSDIQLWIPLAFDLSRANAYNFNYSGVARLRRGATRESAQRDLQRLVPLIPERYPVSFVTKEMFAELRLTPQVHPLRDDVVGDVGQVLWVILGTAGFVLLIACANVANLFLARAEGRQKEIAVRTALGAGRRDLLRFALAESLFLAALGGAAGVGLALVGIRALVRLAPASVPRLSEVSVDARVLGVAALVTVLAGLLFSVLPLVRYRAMSLASMLKEGGRGASVGRERHRARNALVVAQVALALVLLAGSGLMARSFWHLRSVDPGFDSTNVLTLRLALPGVTYPRDEDRARFYSRLVDRLRGLSGVRGAGAVGKLPLRPEGQSNSGTWIEDVTSGSDAVPPMHPNTPATDGYFKALGIPLLEGRDFEPAERERRSGAVLVSESFARRYWKEESPIGKRLRPVPTAPWYTIVGVVGSVRGAALEQPPEEMIYYPMVAIAGDTAIGVSSSMSLVVRTTGDPRGAMNAVRREVRALDAGLPIFNLRPMEEVMRGSMARTSFTLLLLGIASAVALLLGAVGIYGVISYTVSLRTREIGVRIALGARSGDVGWLVTRQGIALALIGVALGLGGALGLTRLLSTLLFEVSPIDPLALGAASVALIAVAAAASALPAFRAARVDPVEALRAEG
ncbi:MAG: ABC transporter permease [Gemmatimonadota bacterium]|nr:ABC transporter permease [Gemmatimonadota bacterium]